MHKKPPMAVTGRVRLDLIAGRCIETAARREYARLLSSYFRCRNQSDRPVIEEQIDGLGYFLQHADFSFLRRCCPEMTGNSGVRAMLTIPPQRERIRIRLPGRTILPRWKNRVPPGRAGA